MTETLPQLVIPGHTWRWFNPQGGLPLSTTCIQLMGPGDLTPVATIRRNDDGTWVALGAVNGMAGIIAGSWTRSLTVEVCASAIAAHLAAARPAPKPPVATLDKSTGLLAMRIYAKLTAQWDAYQAECASDRAQGYGPSHCEHGTLLWVSHDPICGPCEDGDSLRSPLSRRRIALDVAKERRAAAARLIRWACEASKHGIQGDEIMSLVKDRYNNLMEV